MKPRVLIPGFLLLTVLFVLPCLEVFALDIPLDAEERALTGSRVPLADRRLGRVTFESKAPCLTCGDSLYLSTDAVVMQRIAGDFMTELKQQLRSNGVLSRTATQRLSLEVTLMAISHDHTKGASAQRAAPMTNGGELVTTLTLQYVIQEGDRKILQQAITTRGASSSFGDFAPPEALSTALGKNLRIFLLGLKAALAPSFMPVAEKHIQDIDSEHEDTRSLLGYFLKGMAHVGVGAGTVLNESVEILGSDAMVAAVGQAAADVQAMQADVNRAQGPAANATTQDAAAAEGSGAGVTQGAVAAPSGTAPAEKVAHFYCSAFIDHDVRVAASVPEFYVSRVFSVAHAEGAQPWPDDLKARWAAVVKKHNARVSNQAICSYFEDRERAVRDRERWIQRMSVDTLSLRVRLDYLDWVY